MDEGLRELIDREVDGEIEEHEAARLRDALERDPDARAYRDEVVRLVRRLQAIPPAAPPAGIKHEVMGEIQSEHRRVVKPRRWYEPILQALEPPRLRTGFVFAGGAALGLFAAWLALGGDVLTSGARYDVAGAMAVDVRELSGFGRWETPVSGGSVVVETRQGSGVTVAEVSIRADSRVAVTLDLEPAKVGPVGYTSRGRAPDRLQVEGGRVTITQYGEGRVVLFLEPRTASGSVVSVTVDEGGRLKDGTLNAPGLGG